MELARTNERVNPRLALASPHHATLKIGGRSYEATIRDYGLKGFGMTVESGALKRLEIETRDVEMRINERRFTGVVRHSRSEKDLGFVGIQTATSSRAEGISFTNDDPGWDLIENPETIAELFDDVRFKGPEVLIEVRQPSGRALAFAKSLDDSTLEMEVHAMESGELQPTATSFRFEIFQTSHAFEAKIGMVNGNTFTLPLPKTVARLLRRETVRVRNGTNGVNLTIELSSRLLGEPAGEVKLFDFGEHGLSIVDPTGWAGAPVGVPIERIEIRTPDGQRITGHGMIRGHRWENDAGGYVTGLSFETKAYAHRTRWHNAILSARYPALVFDYKDDHHPGIWDLFKRSGYLGIMPEETTSHLLDITRGTWRKLSEAGTSFSKRAVIQQNDKIVGHLQLDRIFPKTWVAHHLALDPEISKVVGKEIYAITTDVLSGEGARYLLAFADAAKPWNQRNYYDFVKQYRFPEHNEIKLFQTYEVKLANPRSLEISKDLVCRPANRWDLARIARYYDLYGTQLERGGCSLGSGEDLELRDFDAEYAKYGLSRKREFIVALRNNQLVGFARVETGTTGVNIFGLLDMLFVNVIPQSGANDGEVTETLLEVALQRFRELRRTDVLIQLEDKRADYYKERGLPYIFETARWLADCAATRRYHAFTQMMFGHLLLRRSKIRQKHAAKDE